MPVRIEALASATLLWVATGAAGCGVRSDAPYRADTAGRRDSIAAVAAASMDDGAAMGLLGRTHAADSALGALGAARGSSSEVKDFGRMIEREDHALRRELGDVASRIAVEIREPDVAPDAPPDVMRDTLMLGTAGASWDRRYIDYAVALHTSAMENAARALAATRRPELKEYIAKTVPVLEKHLEKAKSLQKALSKAAATGGSR